MGSKVSVITAACNQGDWVRKTVPRIRESLDGLEHEIIVVDDQSEDGCCHGLDRDVLVARSHHRLGVSGARRLGYEKTEGDVIVYTDPHCEYPDAALARLVRAVLDGEAAIYQPRTRHRPDSDRTYLGAKLQVEDRGLVTAPVQDKPALFPALYNTIYAMRRDTHERLGGWPLLPGVWGYSEQALTLTAWLYAVPIFVADCLGIHHLYQKDRQFPYTVPARDFGRNAFYVHAGLMPETYPIYWRRILIDRFGEECEEAIKPRDFRVWRDHVKKHRTRTEREVFRDLLQLPFPGDLISERGLITDQRKIVRLMPSTQRQKRVVRAYEWMARAIPGCLAGRTCLDVGCREGYGAEWLHEKGARKVEAVELLPDIAKKVDQQITPTVRQGDIRNLPDDDGAWNLITCSHVIEHVPDPDRARDELVRVLSPGGWLFMVVPQESVPKQQSGHHSSWATDEAFKRWLLEHPDLEPTTYKTETFRTHKQRHEYRVVVRKRHKPARLTPSRQATIEGLHVAVFTSVSPWHPSTDILKRSMDSLFDMLGSRVECHLYCDQSPTWATADEAAAYREYLERLKRLRYGPLSVAERHDGLLGSVRRMMAANKEPFILHHQHDFEYLEASRIDMRQLLQSLEINRRTQYVCFLKRGLRERDASRYLPGWEPVPADDGTRLTAFNGWSCNPHLATARHYRKFVMPNTANDTGIDGLAGFEKDVCRAYMRAQRQDGFRAAQARWGIWLYGHIGDSRYVRHLGQEATTWRKERLQAVMA